MGADPAPLNQPADDAGADHDDGGGGDPPGPSAPAAALADLVAGRWSRWSGLTPSTTLDDATAQLGPSADAEPHSGMFIGPTMFRRWGTGPGAPGGLTLWFEGPIVVGVDVRGARRDPADAALPEPDAVLESGFGDAYRQWVWGARGLVVHRPADDATSAELLLGLAPFDPVQWETDPLRWWGRTRRRR